MPNFRVCEPVTFNPNVVEYIELDDDQARRRSNAVERKNKSGNKYTINTSVQFKVGEVIGLKELPKGMETKLEEHGSVKAAEAVQEDSGDAVEQEG